MGSRSNIFEKYARITGTLVFLLVFLLLDILLGLLFVPENFQSFRIPHPCFHHGIEADRSEITNWGQIYYPFYSNSLGFRDDSTRIISLETDKKRILFLGDSHTEAVGVLYENSFVGRLEEYFTNRNVDILNASVVSYSPKIHYLKCKYLLEEVGLDLDEIFIVIDMSDLNNEIAYEYFEPRRPSSINETLRKTGRSLSRKSLTAYILSVIVKKQRNKFFFRHVYDASNANFELYATFFNEFENTELLNNPNFHNVSRWFEDERFRELALYSLELGQANIKKLIDLCAERQIRVTLTVHPWQDQVLKGETENLYVSSWKRFAELNNVRFINLFPVFINHNNPVITVNKNYIKEDNHWNKNGHEMVFMELKKYIID